MASPSHTLPRAPAHGLGTVPAARTIDGGAVQAAVETERQRTRAWLHDTVLQVLEYLAAGGYADTPDPEDLMRVAGDAAVRLRGVVERRPDAPAPLPERLRAVVAEQEALAVHPISLVVGRVDGPVEPDGARELAAAVHEALTNVRKHARASSAVVSCHVDAGAATVVVSDDGVGFDVQAARGGVGLRESIVARLQRRGGSAAVDSEPGVGTRVTLRLPPLPGFLASVAGAA